MNEFEDAEQERPPSKSMRKRDAHAAQKLGERLTHMRPEEVAALPLTEPLQEAIAEARRLRSRSALGRQYQFIGKLMRDLDMDALYAALDSQTDAQNTRARLRK